jgi:hypothetical protein
MRCRNGPSEFQSADRRAELSWILSVGTPRKMIAHFLPVPDVAAIRKGQAVTKAASVALSAPSKLSPPTKE